MTREELSRLVLRGLQEHDPAITAHNVSDETLDEWLADDGSGDEDCMPTPDDGKSLYWVRFDGAEDASVFVQRNITTK